MATSGLDHDVKIWTPTSDIWPVAMKGIKRVRYYFTDLYFTHAIFIYLIFFQFDFQRICDNIRTRESEREESSSDSDLNDNRLFLSLIQRLNRTPLVNGNLFHGIFVTACTILCSHINKNN